VALDQIVDRAEVPASCPAAPAAFEYLGIAGARLGQLPPGRVQRLLLRAGLGLDLAKANHVGQRPAPGECVALRRRAEVVRPRMDATVPKRLALELPFQELALGTFASVLIADAPLTQDPLSLQSVHTLILPRMDAVASRRDSDA
jgi:hypothetical protein